MSVRLRERSVRPDASVLRRSLKNERLAQMTAAPRVQGTAVMPTAYPLGETPARALPVYKFAGEAKRVTRLLTGSLLLAVTRLIVVVLRATQVRSGCCTGAARRSVVARGTVAGAGGRATGIRSAVAVARSTGPRCTTTVADTSTTVA